MTTLLLKMTNFTLSKMTNFKNQKLPTLYPKLISVFKIENVFFFLKNLKTGREMYFWPENLDTPYKQLKKYLICQIEPLKLILKA